jgi:hypothetical protein
MVHEEVLAISQGHPPASSAGANPEIRGIRRRGGEFRKLLRASAGLFPLTPAGAILACFAGTALALIGVRRSDLVILSATFLTLAAVLLMALAVSAAALGFRVGRRHRAEAAGLLLECGTVQSTGFIPPWPARLPLLDFDWAWEAPAGARVEPELRGGRWLETVVLEKRGDHPGLVRRFEVRDVLGLASVSWREGEARPVRAIPHRGKLDNFALLDGLAGGDDLSDPRGEAVGDRVDMRQYSQGDSPRMILWKVYARTRKLLVRVPERAVAARPRSCAYMVAGEGDEASAGFLRVVLERGFLGEGWRFGADGSAGSAGSPGEALDLLVRSGHAEVAGASGLREFLARAEQDGYSSCFIAVPPQDGPWVGPFLDAAASTRMRVHVYAAVDGRMEEGRPPRRWARLFLTRDLRGISNLEGLRALGGRLGGVPYPCLLVSRSEGRLLGDLRRVVPSPGPRG